MGIITGYSKPAPVNPYKGDIDAMVDAGEGAAYELIAPTKAVEGQRGSVATERVKFQNAARDAGYTAVVVEDSDRAGQAPREDGNTRLVFILTDKRERTVKEKAADAAKADAEAKPSK